MELNLGADVQAKLDQLAAQQGKQAQQVVQELVTNYLLHDDWFRAEVGKGLESLDNGKAVSHEQVQRDIDRLLGL